MIEGKQQLLNKKSLKQLTVSIIKNLLTLLNVKFNILTALGMKYVLINKQNLLVNTIIRFLLVHAWSMG